MDFMLIPNVSYLDQQFGYLDAFLGGTRTLRFQLMKGGDDGTNIRVAATLITKRLVEIYQKPDGVHPYILHCLNLLRDTIFAVRSEFLTQEPDKSAIKIDEKDAETYMNTSVFDIESREYLHDVILKLRRMIQKHREYVDKMEKDRKTFYSLKERVQSRQRSIRKRFCGKFDTVLTKQEDVKLNVMYQTDIRLNAFKKAFRIMGFDALKRHSVNVEKKVELEVEMKKVHKKIMWTLEDALRIKLTKAMAQLIKIHEAKCVPQNSEVKMHNNIRKMSDNFDRIISDLLESNSMEYSYRSNKVDIKKFDFMNNIANFDGFLMGKTVEFSYYEKKICGMKFTDFMKCINPVDSEMITDNMRYIMADNYNKTRQGSFLGKTKGKEIHQKLVIGDLGFGWIKPSRFSSDRKWGFYSLKDVIPRQS